jgi:hypothetical protein
MDPMVPFRFCHRHCMRATRTAAFALARPDTALWPRTHRIEDPQSLANQQIRNLLRTHSIASGSRRIREDTPFAGGYLAFHLSIPGAETPVVVETGARHLSSPPDGACAHGDARRPATMTIERSRTFK